MPLPALNLGIEKGAGAGSALLFSLGLGAKILAGAASLFGGVEEDAG